jgi:hypothetical protein
MVDLSLWRGGFCHGSAGNMESGVFFILIKTMYQFLINCTTGILAAAADAVTILRQSR